MTTRVIRSENRVLIQQAVRGRQRENSDQRSKADGRRFSYPELNDEFLKDGRTPPCVALHPATSGVEHPTANRRTDATIAPWTITKCSTVSLLIDVERSLSLFKVSLDCSGSSEVRVFLYRRQSSMQLLKCTARPFIIEPRK